VLCPIHAWRTRASIPVTGFGGQAAQGAPAGDLAVVAPLGRLELSEGQRLRVVAGAGGRHDDLLPAPGWQSGQRYGWSGSSSTIRFDWRQWPHQGGHGAAAFAADLAVRLPRPAPPGPGVTGNAGGANYGALPRTARDPAVPAASAGAAVGFGWRAELVDLSFQDLGPLCAGQIALDWPSSGGSLRFGSAELAWAIMTEGGVLSEVRI